MARSRKTRRKADQRRRQGARAAESHRAAERLAEAYELQEQGRRGEARQLAEAIPNSSDAAFLVGVIALGEAELPAAREAFERAIGIEPDFAEAYANLGVVLRQLRELDLAIEAFRKAAELLPELPEAQANLGEALSIRGDHEAAIESLSRAVELRPEDEDFQRMLRHVLTVAKVVTDADSLFDLGNHAVDSGQLTEAIERYREALEIDPSMGSCHNNLALALLDIGRLGEAIEHLRGAIDLVPDNAALHSFYLYVLHYDAAYDAPALLAEHREWDRRHGRVERVALPPRRPGERKLRVGYLSPDFRDHVIGRIALALLEHHDRESVEVYCYSNVRAPDALTDLLRSAAGNWREIRELDDEAAAQLIAADELDVLVDLALHTEDNRLPVFARRPAPIQATYLAYCSTSGMDAMDYRMSDPYLDPDGTDLAAYAEETVRLARSYWLYEPLGETPPPEPMPSVKTGAVTFGCLNNFSKISPDAVEAWAKILRAIPASRLILRVAEGDGAAGIAERFAAAGVEADRLALLGAQLWDAYLHRYSEIDIALDPFPYGGGITTCDALWMGVPVVTLSGQTAVGRGGRSILSNIGLPELVAADVDEYARLAVGLAADSERRRSLRAELRPLMEASPLRDPAAFARDVEAALRTMD